MSVNINNNGTLERVASEDTAQIADIVNVYGSKNLLSYPYYENTKTQNGVTFTDNGDGTITVNGTATADTYYTLHSRYQNDVNNLILKNGTYTLTGSPSSASYTTSYLKIGRTSGGAYQEYGADMGSGVTVTLNGDDYSPNEVEIQVQIVVKSGATVTNLTFRPMLRLASIEDDTYVPYVPTNAKLDEEKVSYDDVSESVQKNLLSYPYYETTKTLNGITFTDLGDGTIKANGTATADAQFNATIALDTNKFTSIFTSNKLILSGCPSGGANNYFVRIRVGAKSGGTYINSFTDYGDSVEIPTPPASNETYQVQLVIVSGTTVSNLTFKPMLRKATIKDDTWQPYILNNNQLVGWTQADKSVKKNLIPCTASTIVKTGITFTVNDDKTIKVNGTNTGSTANVFDIGDFTLKAGTYYFSGTPSGAYTSNVGARLQLINVSTSAAIALNESPEDTRVVIASDTQVRARIWYSVSATLNNVIFKPMVRLASIKDDTYAPYIPDNTELTTWKANGVLGAKNLIPYPYKETTKTINGITFTDNGDGTITANGTATSEAIIVLYQNSVSLLKAGRYILSGCPKGGGTSIYKIQATSTNWSFNVADFGDGAVIHITNELTQLIQYIRISIGSGQTISNLTFKPMLRLAEDTDDTYQPYAMTNRELTPSGNKQATRNTEIENLSNTTNINYSIIGGGLVVHHIGIITTGAIPAESIIIKDLPKPKLNQNGVAVHRTTGTCVNVQITTNGDAVLKTPITEAGVYAGALVYTL